MSGKTFSRVLVCGSRDWTNRDRLYAALDGFRGLLGITTVIHGAARGADRLGGEWAYNNELTEIAFPADWKRHGKGAGPIRNQQMLTEGKPDFVVAFHDDIEHSKGTKHMRDIAKAAGLRVIVIRSVPPVDDADLLAKRLAVLRAVGCDSETPTP